jgi:hypothetical protein
METSKPVEAWQRTRESESRGRLTGWKSLRSRKLNMAMTLSD